MRVLILFLASVFLFNCSSIGIPEDTYLECVNENQDDVVKPLTFQDYGATDKKISNIYLMVDTFTGLICSRGLLQDELIMGCDGDPNLYVEKYVFDTRFVNGFKTGFGWGDPGSTVEYKSYDVYASMTLNRTNLLLQANLFDLRDEDYWFEKNFFGRSEDNFYEIEENLPFTVGLQCRIIPSREIYSEASSFTVAEMFKRWKNYQKTVKEKIDQQKI